MLLRRFATSAAANRFALPPTIRQLLSHPPQADSNTTVSGWIKSIRKQKNVSFAVITDGSSATGLQAVLVKGKEDDILRKLTNGAAVRLTGRFVASPGAGQAHELVVDHGGEIEVLGECEPETYPIQKKDLTPEYLREHVHLRGRTAHIASMLRMRDDLRRKVDMWFESQDFCHVNTPIITGNDAEGAGETFRLALVESHHPADAANSSIPLPPSEFFARPAYLTVSHQLHLEALATSLSRVYTLSPCFRAERSQTSRHLAEFWMLEAEWAFPQNGVLGICDLTENLIKDTVRNLLETDDMNTLWKDGNESRRKAVHEAVNQTTPWSRMSYTEAIAHLQKAAEVVNFEYAPQWGHPLQSEHERWLAEQFVGGPVFVTDYPATLKPFYMRVNDDKRTVACFDLLVPHVGELVGGSVREERADVLQGKMGDGEGSEWYIDLRKYGGAPHAGFGMGFERLMSWASGVENIRECIPMPRWSGRMLL